MTTHNRYLDQTRAIVAAVAMPSGLDQNTLQCTANFAENARLCLREAYRTMMLDGGDPMLMAWAEQAGAAALQLRDAARRRMTDEAAH